MLPTYTCIQCNITKQTSEFNTKNQQRSLKNIDSFCKDCRKIQKQNDARTRNGMIVLMACSQRAKSKKRGHTPPSYTTKELRKWVHSQPNFEELYLAWKKSNYDTNLKPSCNRLDDYLPYSLDNLELITWKENNEKANYDRRYGINNKHSMGVKQINLNGEVVATFHSKREAHRATGICHSSIGNCCRNMPRYKTAGGYRWEFL